MRIRDGPQVVHDVAFDGYECRLLFISVHGIREIQNLHRSMDLVVAYITEILKLLSFEAMKLELLTRQQRLNRRQFARARCSQLRPQRRVVTCTGLRLLRRSR